MATLNLPSELTRTVTVSGRVTAKVMQDLTVYLVGPSESEFQFLVDLYESLCPADRLVRYKIAELEFWPRIASPILTASGRAAAAGVRQPYFEPTRRRIRDGRAFEARFWDGREIDDADGSWNFSCRSIHLRSTGLHSFVRILIPLKADCEILRRAALAIADRVQSCSGHGGLVFVYDPWLKEDGLDAIYALSRRFWGVEVEDLNYTLPLMKEHLKGVNWITLVGQQFTSTPEIQAELDKLAQRSDVTIEQRRHAAVLIAGPQPVAGDQHRPDSSLDPYYAVARAIEPLFLTAHPDFSGAQFIDHGNTLGWIRRFLDPDGWR
ncbi:MAG TPA: type VI immunity family protein [Blastocatellia bacterium]|nr:type VI immunity family protein [Blastocatellia bacterium]